MEVAPTYLPTQKALLDTSGLVERGALFYIVEQVRLFIFGRVIGGQRICVSYCHLSFYLHALCPGPSHRSDRSVSLLGESNRKCEEKECIAFPASRSPLCSVKWRHGLSEPCRCDGTRVRQSGL